MDVCIRTANEPEKRSSSHGVVNKATLTGEKIPPSPSAPAPAPSVAQPESQEPLDRLELMKKKLSEALKARNAMQNELAEKPFMEMARRKLFKKNIPLLDVRIKRLKLDITTTEMLKKMTPDELENPQIVKDYQHYDSKETRKK